MQLIRYLNKKLVNASVASIGNYDGMHLGHQKILSKVSARAAHMKLPSVVIIFEPQPMEFFLEERTNPRLMTLREKLVIFKNYNIDYVLCLRFNAQLASLTAQKFIQNILLNKLNAQYIIIGDDFSFGCNRTGGFELLQEYIKTEKIATVQIDDTKVSSSHIRQALAIGDFKTAEKLLGRPYSMSGKVAYGDKLGHKLGFPTANIYLQHKILAITGVFIVKVTGLSPKPISGVANVGTRPTIDGTRNVLEVHLLNFNKDIYGQRIQVQFIEKIRDEIKFASLDLLKQQIAKDVKQALRY
jgi:riboflavin kinase/FMN adenylyltransferase